MRTLYGIRQSPWTERASWALDHHAVLYHYHEHLPMVGELLLRRKARTNAATVPLLSDGDQTVMGSFEIARHAERIGRGAPLFPRTLDAEVARWNELAERMTRAGRAWLMRNLASSREAQREALPGFVPGPLRGALASSSAMAVRFLSRKHAISADVDAEIERALRPALLEVRAALGSRPYLLDVFSYADIAVATSLQALRPHESARLGPATRAAWTNEALAADFDDLLMWRDAIVRKHR